VVGDSPVPDDQPVAPGVDQVRGQPLGGFEVDGAVRAERRNHSRQDAAERDRGVEIAAMPAGYRLRPATARPAGGFEPRG
jgi:hypothetical protein